MIPCDRVGRQTAVTDPLGRTGTRVFDAAGQPTVAIDPLGFRTTTSFDGAGNPVTVLDANGKLTTTVYESNSNRLSASVSALGLRTSFVYDAAGRNTTLIDVKGQVQTQVFDSIGQVTGIHYADGSRVAMKYDALGRRREQSCLVCLAPRRPCHHTACSDTADRVPVPAAAPQARLPGRSKPVARGPGGPAVLLAHRPHALDLPAAAGSAVRELLPVRGQSLLAFSRAISYRISSAEGMGPSPGNPRGCSPPGQ